MAQSKENQKAFGKTKNSKMYAAGNSNSFDVCDERESDSPRRNSVPLIRSVFESTSSERPAGNSQTSLPGQKGSAKSSFPCSPETKKSSLETVCELKQSDINPTCFQDSKNNSKSSREAQSRASGCVMSNNDLRRSEAKSYASPNLDDNKKTNDPCDTNSNDEQGSKSNRPGSLRLQPASNVRGPLINTKYLKLTKFNDITVYHGSKKISNLSVDELDKKIDDRCFPVAAAASVAAAAASVDAECADDASVDKSLDDSEDSESHFESDFVLEFEGTGTGVNRPALKTSKSLIKKVSMALLRSSKGFNVWHVNVHRHPLYISSHVNSQHP